MAITEPKPLAGGVALLFKLATCQNDDAEMKEFRDTMLALVQKLLATFRGSGCDPSEMFDKNTYVYHKAQKTPRRRECFFVCISIFKTVDMIDMNKRIGAMEMYACTIFCHDLIHEMLPRLIEISRQHPSKIKFAQKVIELKALCGVE